MQTITR